MGNKTAGKMRGERFNVIALVMIIALIIPFLVQAAESPPTGTHASDQLFTELPLAADTSRVRDPVVVRQRQVAVDFGLMAAPDTRPGDRIGVQQNLVLNLFEDITVTAVIDHITHNVSGSRSWVGTVQDRELSEIVMVVRDGMMMANISFDGHFYQVRYVAPGLHIINEIDQSQFPLELEPIPEEPVEEVESTLPGQSGLPSLPGADRDSSPTADDGSVIRVLVVYTDDARAAQGGTAAMETVIDLAISETNAGYANSNLTQRVVLAHAEEVSYNESGLNWSTTLGRLRSHTDGYMDEAHALRDAYEADEVVLIIENTSYCGLAYLMTTVAANFADSAFSLVSRVCATGYYSFAHELGHNMGARHDWYVDQSTTPYTYSHGYVNPADFWRTVMAYNTECADSGWNCGRINYWSNPDVLYGGDHMGVAAGTSTACTVGDLAHPECDANNRLSHNNTRFTVANFRTDGSADGVTTYSQDFENFNSGYNLEEEGWYYQDINGDNYSWYISTYLPYNGSQYARLPAAGGTVANDWMFSKGLYLESGETYRITFYARDFGSSETVRLSVGSLPNEYSMAMLQQWPVSGSRWAQYTEDFTAVSTGIHYFGWHAAPSPGDAVGIDSVTIDAIDAQAPEVTDYSPVDNASGVAVDANLVLTFNETIVKGSGNITIKRSSNNSVVEIIDVTSGQLSLGTTSQTNDTATINPSGDLDPATGYYVQIDAGAFEDSSGNSFAGILDTTTWNFNTLISSSLTLEIVADAVSEGDGASATTATVTRNSDTTEALAVSLSSNDISEATVPTSVEIPAGQASVIFNIDAVDDAVVDGTQVVTLTAAALAHADGTDNLDVTDDDLAELTLEVAVAAVSEGDGASATTATVSRNTDTTAALTVNLSSSDTSEAMVPVSVQIPAGQASTSFDIDAVDDALVDGTQVVTITASAASHEDGTDTLDVTDNDTAALTLVVAAPSVSENSGTAATTATVTRNTSTTVALTVNLLSSDTSEATVPASVQIPAGQVSATFDIDAVDDVLVDGTQVVTITASAAAHADGTDTLNVTDDESPLLTLVVNTALVSEGAGAAATFATVTRNTDTTGALFVNLSSNDISEATVPASVQIPAGQASATFDIDAVDDIVVDGTQTVTLTAAAAGHTSGTDTLDVTDDDSICYPDSQQIDGPLDLGGVQIYQSQGTLTTSGAVVVKTNAQIVFEATDGIGLNPGFRVENDAAFRAWVHPVTCL